MGNGIFDNDPNYQELNDEKKSHRFGGFFAKKSKNKFPENGVATTELDTIIETDTDLVTEVMSDEELEEFAMSFVCEDEEIPFNAPEQELTANELCLNPETYDYNKLIGKLKLPYGLDKDEIFLKNFIKIFDEAKEEFSGYESDVINVRVGKMFEINDNELRIIIKLEKGNLFNELMIIGEVYINL